MIEIEFELGQPVLICDPEHVYDRSSGTISRLEGDNYYIVRLDLIDEETEVTGDQIVPYEDAVYDLRAFEFDYEF